MAFTIKSRLGRGRTIESFAATLEVDSERFEVVVKRPRAEFKTNVAFSDALIAWGEPETVTARVREHLDAGANHVSVQVLFRPERWKLARPQWRALAEALGLGTRTAR